MKHHLSTLAASALLAGLCAVAPAIEQEAPAACEPANKPWEVTYHPPANAKGVNAPVVANDREVDELSIRVPLINLLDFRMVEEEAFRLDVLDIPLLRGETRESRGAKAPRTSTFADVPVFRLAKLDFASEAEDEASGSVKFLEIPFLALLEGRFDEAADEGGFSLISGPIVTAFCASEANDRTSWAVLDTFAGTTAGKQARSDENWRAQVLDLSLVKGLRSTKDGADRKMDVLDFTVLEAYDYEKSGDEGVVRFVRAPWTHLYRKEFSDAHQKTDVANLPLKFLLYRNESDDEGASEVKVLRLPILGSTFARTDDARHTRTKVLWFFNFAREKSAD